MTAHALRMLFVSALLGMTGIATAALSPASHTVDVSAPDLDAMLPRAFDGWSQVDLATIVLPQESETSKGEAVAYRAYADELGRIVTVVAAYGPPLSDSVRLHRPETCYAAQGFSIRSRSVATVSDRLGDIPVVNLDAESQSRRESVTYWLREGSTFTTSAGDLGWRRLRRGFGGSSEGALLRVSTVSRDAAQFDLNMEFLAAFADALGADARAVLLGEESV